MKVEDIKKVAVIGAGIMGTGIAQVCAQAGYEVGLRDIEDEFVERSISTMKSSLGKLVQKGKISQGDADAIIGRIKGTTDLKEAAGDADLVIEAVVENMDVKKQVFKELDEICPERTIFASNTSSLSITEMAAATKRPEKVVGMHFFNPVPVMRLVEIVRGLTTSDETVEVARAFAEKLGKTPVVCKDSPGFIANRIALPSLNEAMFALMEGVAPKEDIDTAMKLGYNWPMGPLELADLVGLDTLLAVFEVFYNEFGDPKYRPCPLLRQMVRAGYLGRKTGKGFYEYK
ncbi:MAG: 3-hydroxyacyl-CoA dehydrogenase [Candidatus Alkanophagales archaeon MCA70_species_1]|nr:3-hydroxyacyl-CoA dehydrogenase [Candidatus Alkanophaga volatiphilum]